MADTKAAAAPLQTGGKMSRKKLILYCVIGALMVIVPVVFQAATGLAFFVRILVIVGIWVLLALGLNIVVGYAGLLDLGYIAFYAMGILLHADTGGTRRSAHGRGARLPCPAA
jgi:ABC-type branched-subunit amino acid transport system permease subunit